MIKCLKYGICGGCDFIKSSYEEELSEKMAYVESLLGDFCTVAPIVGMDNPWHYRNKIQSAFGTDRNGYTISGIYKANSHKIVQVSSCMLEDKEGDSVLRSIQNIVKRRGVVPYNEDTGKGILRHVLIKRAVSTNETMVVFICSSYKFPGIDAIVHELVRLHPSIKSILINRNREKSSMVLSSEPDRIMYGEEYITDRLCGLDFRISAKSFYQVNPYQAKRLYTIAMRMACLTGKESVIDAYCGTGTISLIAASCGALKVTGIELNLDACNDACENARINNIQNVSFVNGDASEVIKQMSKDKISSDVVFLDPPRSGSDERFLSSVIKINPKTIIYISCNPETLSRDLRYLTSFGPYSVRGIQPVDMFPHTKHVETVVLLCKK